MNQIISDKEQIHDKCNFDNILSKEKVKCELYIERKQKFLCGLLNMYVIRTNLNNDVPYIYIEKYFNNENHLMNYIDDFKRKFGKYDFVVQKNI